MNIAVPMDEQTYKKFCETYTHPTPLTAPNAHNSENVKHVGGVYQTEGSQSLVNELPYLIGQAAMIASSMFNRNELIDDLKRLI
jgi:hypothetical protein